MLNIRPNSRRIAPLARKLVVLLILHGAAAHGAGAVPGGARITDHLYGTRFVTADDGWAVGAFGTIFRTHDGGRSWDAQVSGTLEQLFSVDFADVRTGWAVGRAGVIVHTSDGGTTWRLQATPKEQHLFKVRVIDAQRAWAVGDWGTVLATRNGGQTWEDRSLPRDVILYSQAWPDAQHGWVIGEAGAIVATQDGGATWTEQTSGVEKTLFGVSFTDAQHGWAVGLDGIILRTRDGGQSWQLLHGDADVDALEQVGFKEAFDNPSLYDVVVTPTFGYAVGDNGAVFVSTDGGSSWTRAAVPAAANLRWLRAASVVSGTHGLLVGANGLTLQVTGSQITLPENQQNAPAMAD